jgi:hypothetical protein
MNMFPLVQRTGAYQFKYRIYTDEYADGCTQVDATGTRVSTRGDDFRSSLQVRSLGPCLVLLICTLDGAVSLLTVGKLRIGREGRRDIVLQGRNREYARTQLA